MINMANENVVGYVDNLTQFGIIAPKRRSLIITNQRVLILDVSSTSSTAAAAGFAYVFGIFGRGMANSISKEDIENTTEKLSKENLDELLKSNPENIELKNDSVTSVEINRKQVLIKADGKTFKYGIANPDAKNKDGVVYESYIKALQTALGSKVIAK